MSLLFIGHSGYAYPHVRVRCYNFAKTLSDLGMETEVLSFKDHLSPARYTEEIMYDLKDIHKLYLSFKAFLKLIGKKKHIFYIQKLLFHASAPLLLSKLGRNQYILDCDDWDAKYSSLYTTRLLNKLFFNKDVRCDRFGNVHPDDYTMILKETASNALACIVSSHLLKELLSDSSRSVHYIPTGVDVESFKRDPSHEKTNNVKICWNGLIWGDVIFDNLLFLLQCFSKIKDENPNVELKIVASGQLVERVKEVIRLVYNDESIEMVNWMKPEEMPQFLSSVDVGVIPLIQKDNPWVCSKSPTKLFEFMAMGLPTVVSAVGENNYIIEDGIDGFLADNKEEFIEKLSLLVKNEELRKKMGVKAKEKIEKNYSLKILGKRLFSILKEIEDRA